MTVRDDRAGAGPLPAIAHALLKLLSEASASRAREDLLDVHARVARLRGRRAADVAVLREAVAIVVWSVLDGMRHGLEKGRGRAARGRRASMLGDFAQDVRYGVRALGRRPGFTLLVVAVLALGIGAVTSITTIVDRLFFAPPAAVHAPHELVRLFRSWAPGEGGSMAYADFLEYREARSLAGLVAYEPNGIPATFRHGAALGPANVRTVSDGYFALFGVAAERGRFFRAEENSVPGGHPVTVLSFRFWQEQLRGASDAVGSTVLLNGHPFMVIGVAPQAFRGISPGERVPDFYIPIMMRDALAPSTDTAWRERLPESFERWLTVVGRLRPGVTVDAARAELEAISARIRATYPTEAQDETVLVTDAYRWSPTFARSLTATARLLLGVVGLVLAVALANVVILLLARASTREREIGIRAALGAGRGRVMRQLMTEALLLAVAGGMAGVALSLWTTRIVATLLPARLDPLPVVNGRVLLFAAALSGITAIVIGAAPSLRTARGDVVGLVQGRGRGVRGGRLRDALVVVQVALSLVLLAAAALFARSLAAARSLDLGFASENVLTVQVNLRNHGYDIARARTFIVDALARLESLPGIEAVATSRQLPFRGEWSSSLRPPAGVAEERVENVGRNTVSAGYFQAMGIPIVAGRPILDGDVADAPPVIVVNETFARSVFPDGNALGQAVPLNDGPPFTIVGIAQDATYYDLGETARSQVYSPVLQFMAPNVTFIVRTTGPPLDFARPVRDALYALDADLALHLETLEQIEAEQVATFRATAHVVGLSGVITLLLASAGLYGVMAYRVSERTREIGLRLALGETAASVARRVLGGGLRLTIAGLLIGTAAVLAFGRIIGSLLFDVQPRDPVSLLAAPLILLAIATLALLVPAMRAMRVDPMRAMRVE